MASGGARSSSGAAVQRRGQRALVLVALVLVAALACSSCSCFYTLPGTGELTLYGSEPTTLDPALCQDATSAGYIVEIFGGLVTLDADLEVVPDIAASWELSGNGTVYTFHVREGVTFHDGREVTAQDVKYSIERATDPQTGSPVARTYLGDIVGVAEHLSGAADEVSGVRVVDADTVEVTIDAPKAYFLAKLTHPTAFVVDRYNVESGTGWTEHPNGTGPFRLAQWQHSRTLVLERNDGYHRGAATLERVTFMLTGNPILMYENGEVDIAPVSAASIERVTDPTNPLHDELVTATELSVWYIGLNTTMPPFDDEKVRQAFCYAVDKAKIIEILFKDMVSPADGILPPGLPGYSEAIAGLDYDVAQAQALIAASSYSDGLPPITLSVSGAVSSVDAAVLWMWQEYLGAEVQIEVMELGTFLEEMSAVNLQAFAIGWIADYPDPENFLDVLFHSGSDENHTGYSDPVVDQKLEAARVEADTEARLELYHEAEQAIVDDAPWLPLWFGENYFLVKPSVKGFQPAPMGIPILKDIWIEM